MCESTLNGGALICGRPDPHATGHTYAATTDDLGHGRHSEQAADQ